MCSGPNFSIILNQVAAEQMKGATVGFKLSREIITLVKTVVLEFY